MPNLEDYKRYLQSINDYRVDPATKIRLAEAIRLAVERDPALLEQLGLTVIQLNGLPKH